MMTRIILNRFYFYNNYGYIFLRCQGRIYNYFKLLVYILEIVIINSSISSNKEMHILSFAKDFTEFRCL